ncbi:MAG TPA: HEAT repeat domain-containing protein [Gemmatimonadales bacterium]|nr:HEAT repeat domain-containing protein [Gemmatimonadales bacterium]
MPDLSALERALGAIGTAFRLHRLYPPSHRAVQEAMRQVEVLLPPIAELGTVECKVGVTGFHVQRQHLLPRNAQLAEIASLLYARSVRAVQISPGVTTEQVLALFAVATGHLPPGDPSLGRITLVHGRRTTQTALRVPLPASEPPAPVAAGAPPAAATPAATAAAPPPAPVPPPRVGTGARPSPTANRADALPVDVETRRLVGTLATAESVEGLHGAAERLQQLVPDLLALGDIAVVAEVIMSLDRALHRIDDPDLLERFGALAGALADPPIIERLIARLGEARVTPQERGALVAGVGALASVAIPSLIRGYLAAPAELREGYRAAIRAAADRAVDPLSEVSREGEAPAVAAAAHLLGLTGSPRAVPLLIELVKHQADPVREAALYALAELGGREITRPAIPALKDGSAPVRMAAAKVIGLGGDLSTTALLIRRLEQEEDEGVLSELLMAIGRLGSPEALTVLAKHAEPGGFMRRRTVHLRAAAIAGMGHLSSPEARALLALYSHDKEPTVQRAAEAALG